MRSSGLERIGLLWTIALISSSCTLRHTVEPGQLSLDELRIAYQVGNAQIKVISGKGRNILKWPKSVNVRKRSDSDYTYWRPDVHPDQTRLVCVRCVRHFQNDASCELIEIPLVENSSTPHVIYKAPQGEVIHSPVWSPDGSQIAFLIGKWAEARVMDVGIADRQTNELMQRIDLGKSKGREYAWSYTARSVDMNHWGRDYIRWSWDGKRILVWATQVRPIAPQEEFGSVDVASETVRWLVKGPSELGLSLAQFHSVPHHSLEQKYGPYGPKEGLFNSPDVDAMFGSSQYPVACPIWSPNRRYYFYERGYYQAGYVVWIERYDTRTGIRRRIKMKTGSWMPWMS